MTSNGWGTLFRIHSFGESHGPGLGVLIEGCPAGVKIEEERLKQWMMRRRPGQNAWVSARKEPDQVEILSGVFEGKTLGTPICMVARNQDARSEDYAAIKENPRAGHADDVWKSKFGHTDPRGGGRSSGRETLSRVMAAAVAETLVKTLTPEVEVIGYSSCLGPFVLSEEERQAFWSTAKGDFPAEAFGLRFPSKNKLPQIEKLLLEAKENGRSYGGQAEILIRNLPVGLGQPVFRKLKSDFAQAALSLGATMAFELGAGLEVVGQEGSQFHSDPNSQVYGGIRGGISTGEPVFFRTSFKPTSSVLDVAKKGRHDPCIVPRAVPVLEAMSWLILADHILWRRLDRI